MKFRNSFGIQISNFEINSVPNSPPTVSMDNNTIPLIPSTADLNTKLLDIVGQYNSIETSYLRVIASIHNENVELKETNAELKKRIAEMEEEQICQSSLKRGRYEEDNESSAADDMDELKHKNTMLGKEISVKNTKIQNQAKQLKEYKDIIAKLKDK